MRKRKKYKIEDNVSLQTDYTIHNLVTLIFWEKIGTIKNESFSCGLPEMLRIDTIKLFFSNIKFVFFFFFTKIMRPQT